MKGTYSKVNQITLFVGFVLHFFSKVGFEQFNLYSGVVGLQMSLPGAAGAGATGESLGRLAATRTSLVHMLC